jgi:ribosomal-protein-alanine N-acetyltransferase
MLLSTIFLTMGTTMDDLTVEAVFGNLPVLETERLRLRRLWLDDAADVFEYASDPEVSRYTTWETHKTLEDSRAFLTGVIEQYNTFQVAPWGIEHKGDKKLVGAQ